MQSQQEHKSTRIVAAMCRQGHESMADLDNITDIIHACETLCLCGYVSLFMCACVCCVVCVCVYLYIIVCMCVCVCSYECVCGRVCVCVCVT